MNLHNDNLPLAADSYKLSQWKMLRPGTTYLKNYFECRGGPYEKTLYFGLDYYIQTLKNLQDDFDEKKLQYADEYCYHHFNDANVFNRKGWSDLLKKKKGKLPLLIKSAPNNILVEPSNVLFTTESTDPEFVFLVQQIESILMKVWSPITVGTYSYHCKPIIEKYLELTGSDKANAAYKLVDFGYRGVATEDTAAILGLAHLMNFRVTDNNPANLLGCKLYNIPLEKMLGYSVPASEHSIAQLFGMDEKEYLLHLMDVYPVGILSVVIDKTDTIKFVKMVCEDEDIRKAILERKGKLVLRPDSGDPVQITQQVIEMLWNAYSGTYTSTNHKLLIPQLGIIQGDGININSIEDILHNYAAKGFAADNILFGSGGKLLQAHDRDELKCAIKASVAVINDQEVNLFKEPKTDGGKSSKPGHLKLLRCIDKYSTISSANMDKILFDGYKDELEPVFHNGEIVRTPTLNF